MMMPHLHRGQLFIEAARRVQATRFAEELQLDDEQRQQEQYGQQREQQHAVTCQIQRIYTCAAVTWRDML